MWKHYKIIILLIFAPLEKVCAELIAVNATSSGLPGPQIPVIITRVNAVVPTAVGQIGVNPIDLVTVHSDFYLVEEGATKWKGGLSNIVETATIVSDGATVMATKTAQIAVTTATAASEGIEIGDLAITLSPAALSFLEPLFKTAQTVCTVGRVRSRQSGGFGLCSIRQIQGELTSEFTAGLEGSGLEIAKDYGVANFVRYFIGEGAIAAELEGLAGEIMGGLGALVAVEAVPLVVGAVIIMFIVWVAEHVMPKGIMIPKKVIVTHTVAATPTTSSPTTTDTYPYIGQHFMTDIFHPAPLPFNTFLADGLAVALERRFSSLEAMVVPPRPTDCIKQVLRNCMIVLEFDEVPGGPKPCPELPDRPPECPNEFHGRPNEPIPPIAAPTAEAFVFWESPLSCGKEREYVIWEQPYGAANRIYTNCGWPSTLQNPAVRIPDSYERDPEWENRGIDENRELPVTLKLGDFSGKKNCIITQEKVEDGRVNCDGFESTCFIPNLERVKIVLGDSALDCQWNPYNHVEFPLGSGVNLK